MMIWVKIKATDGIEKPGLGLSSGLMSGEDVETTEGLENGPCVRMCAAEKTVIGDLKCPGAVAFDCDVQCIELLSESNHQS